MKRIRIQQGLYVSERVTAETPDEMLAAFAAVKVGADALAETLDCILAACTASEGSPHAEQGRKLANDVSFFRTVFARNEVSDPAWYVVLAMQLASDFEMLRTNLAFEKPARAGFGTMKGGRRNAGDHSRLEAWARAEIASKRPPRGLAARAVRARVTRLTERQALTHLQKVGILPPPRRANRK